MPNLEINLFCALSLSMRIIPQLKVYFLNMQGTDFLQVAS